MPESEIPEQWKNGSEEQTEEAEFDNRWWEVFGDCLLNQLEETGTVNSPNLFVALDKVAQARAIAGVELSSLYPQLNLNPSYSNTGMLFKIFIPPGLLPPTTTINEIFRIHQVQYNLPLNMSYEIDLWGKLRGQYESAAMDAQKQEEDFLNALLTLTADIASSYFQVRLLDMQIDIVGGNLNLLRKSLRLVRTRFDKGLVNYQDVVSAELEFANTEAAYKDTLRQRAIYEDMLGTLIGVPASEFCMPHYPLEGIPPNISPNLPSTILLARPDIAAAEREMAARHALIGVAYASFFPSLQLTSALGFSSPDFGEFLKWNSRLWSIGANIAQPIFDAGRNRAYLNLAYARFNEASHGYRQTVLTAFQEVEDALVNLKYQKEEYESYQRAVGFAKTRLKLSTQRYEQGLNNYLEVIDSERAALQTETQAVNSLGLRYLATIQLIKALGTGKK